MARPTKMDQEQMLIFTQQFYAEKCDNNPELLTPAEIGKYIRSQGYDIADYLVRRNPLIRDYIDKMKNQNVLAKITTVSVYMDVDIDELLRKNSTPNKLKKALIEREAYYMELAHSASIIFAENKKLKAKIKSLESRLDELETTFSDKEQVSKEVLADYKAAVTNNRIYKDIIDTYVCPEIANELLKKQGLIKETAGYLDAEKVHNGVLKADDNVKSFKNNIIKGLFTSIGGENGKEDNKNT